MGKAKGEKTVNENKKTEHLNEYLTYSKILSCKPSSSEEAQSLRQTAFASSLCLLVLRVGQGMLCVSKTIKHSLLMLELLSVPLRFELDFVPLN